MIPGWSPVTLPLSRAYYSLAPVSLAFGAITSSVSQGSFAQTMGGAAVMQGFRFIQRSVPSVDLALNSPLNAINAQNTAAELDGKRYASSFDNKLQFGSRFLADQAGQWNDIYTALLTLRANAAKIQNSSAYNIKNAQSSDAAVLTATAGQNTPAGVYTVTVTRLAQPEQLASNVYAEPDAALGLTGTFKLNGWQSAITPSDTLYNIRDKILATSGATTLTQMGLRATVAGGQLVLQSLNGGNIDIQMDDPNRILESLGFAFRDKITGLLDPNYSNTFSAPPQTAKFSVNGQAYTSAFNTVADGDGGLTLTLAGTGSATVNVIADPAQALAPLKAFSDSYNQVLDLLNTTIAAGGGLSENARLQDIYTGVVRSFLTPPPVATGGFNSLADVGIGVQNQPHRIAQLALEQLSAMQASGSLPGWGRQSQLSETRRVNVNGPNDFKIALDATAMAKGLQNNNSGVKDLMALGASRLQQKLDAILQPEYGTIQMQQQVIGYYTSNQKAVADLMAQSNQVIATEINIQRQSLLLAPLAGQKYHFSAVG